MDRQHLHRLGVGVEPRGCDPRRRCRGSASAIRCRSQAVSARDPELLGRRRDVQQLADVAEVGQSALAVGAREDPPRGGLGRRDRVEQRRDAAAAEQRRPAVQLRVDAPPSAASSAAAICSALQPRKEVSAAARARVRRGRPLERLEQPQPLVRGRGREDAAGAVDHGRDADALERVVHERGRALFVGTSTATCAGPDRLAPSSEPSRRGRPLGADDSSATTSAARSSAMCVRAAAHSTRIPWRVSATSRRRGAGSARAAARRAARRAAAARWFASAARTGRWTMPSWPSWAPSKSASKASISPWSLRQFVASVAACGAARRR